MSSIIQEAIVKHSQGTASAWTSADTVLESGEWGYETDTGNIKIGNGSTAWTSLGYQNSLPEIYDISSVNTVISLPDITGQVQTKTYYWAGGDGSNTFSFTVSDASTIGGVAATLWLGEGGGHITIESDGSNWQVREYEDSGSVADSGVNSNRIWKKDFNGEIIFQGLFSDNLAITTGSIGWFFGNGAVALGKTIAVAIDNIQATSNDADGIIGRYSSPSTTGFNIFFYRGSSATVDVSCTWIAKGRWRA